MVLKTILAIAGNTSTTTILTVKSVVKASKVVIDVLLPERFGRLNL